MSTLTSSAVGGRKAAPKAPPRRRAAAKANEADASQPLPSPAATTAGATQLNEAETRRPPSPPVVVEREVPAPAKVVETVVASIQHDPAIEQSDTIVPVESSRAQRSNKRSAAPIQPEDTTVPKKRARVAKTAAQVSGATDPHAEPAAPGPSQADIAAETSTAAAEQTTATRRRAAPPRDDPPSETSTAAPDPTTSTHRRAPAKRGRAGGRATRTTAPGGETSTPVDPAIVDSTHDNLSTDQVASNLASQMQTSSQTISARAKPRRPRKKKVVSTDKIDENGDTSTLR